MRFTLFSGITALLCCSFLVSAVALLPQQLRPDTSPLPDVSLLQSYDCFSGPNQDLKQFDQQLEQHNYANWQSYIGFSSKNDYPDIVASVHCEVLHYLVNGIQVEAVLMYPKQADQVPVILYNRGGNRGLSAMNFAGIARALSFVRQGYLVVASNYRGTDSWPLYKTDGSVELAPQPIGHDEFGGQDVDDVIALLQLLKHYPQADKNRIALYGVSRGGMMAFQAAALLPQVKAMVVKSGAYDLAALRRPRPEMDKTYRQLIPGYTGQSSRLLDQRSPRYVVHKLKQDLPILILHGTEDDKVEVAQATQMAELLKQQNRPHKLVLYPGGDHYLKDFGKQVDEEVTTWLKLYL